MQLPVTVTSAWTCCEEVLCSFERQPQAGGTAGSAGQRAPGLGHTCSAREGAGLRTAVCCGEQQPDTQEGSELKCSLRL